MLFRSQRLGIDGETAGFYDLGGFKWTPDLANAGGKCDALTVVDDTMTNDNIPKRTYAEISDTTDTYELLARARNQAKKRNFDDVFIVDVDAHVGDNQNWSDVLSFIENPVIRAQAFAFGPTSASRGALLNGQQGLQWQHVGGRIPHGAGIKETPEDKSVPREVAIARKTIDSKIGRAHV